MSIARKILTKKRTIIGIVVILLAAIGYIYGETLTNTTEAEPKKVVFEPYTFVQPETPFLKDNEFVVAAETSVLKLKVHAPTGHFHVEDKRNGQLYRSYPNPEHWENETSGTTWKNHLRSPLMVSIVNFDARRDQSKWTSFLQEEGIVHDFTVIDQGFRITYTMPKQGISVPVEVLLKDDFVETKIIDAGIEESDLHSVAGLRLYPFFGAEQSVGQKGYLFIPDGSGSLIHFSQNRTTGNAIYTERIYGEDWSYGAGSFSNRNSVTMPVFGLKSGDQGFLGIVHEGAEYAEIIGAPSGSLSQYNWATAGFSYRHVYFQPTARNGKTGFNTFEKERIKGHDRSIRYYILDHDDAGYVGMASRYRQYLMEEQGLAKIEETDQSIPLHVGLYGGDVEEGFLYDSYVSVTTTDQATRIVEKLKELGIDRMAITYFGWQSGGNSAYGGNLSVDRRIGGKSGLKEFVEYVKTMGYPVYLDAGIYGYNNTGKDGFRRQRDGMRNLASNLSEFTSRVDNSTVTFVSPRFVQRSLYSDLSYFNELGVSGLYYKNGLGQDFSTDFNERHFASRSDVNQIMQDIYEKTADELGTVVARNPNLSLLKNVDHIYNLYDDYSYDVFIDESVPFVQIALHGLVSYSTSYINERDDYQREFLKSIEYGAEPSVVLSYASTNTLLKTKTLSRFYSTHYNDWLVEIVKQYQRYNEALSSVQDQYIVNHRTIVKGVRETTYANGLQVIVNYNSIPYRSGSFVVEAEDFAVIQGGE